jgi:hypothetical protein
MALQYSPKIVQDSLVMCLDASQNKSYPTDLPVKNGLLVWLDAADDSTFSYSSGTEVSQWRDKSGNNFHANQATTANQPSRSSVINSRKGVNFTSTNGDFIRIPNGVVFSKYFTAVVVVKPGTQSAEYAVILDQDHSTTGYQGWVIQRGASTSFWQTWVANSSANNWTNANQIAYVDNTSQIVTLRKTSSTLALYSNGTSSGDVSINDYNLPQAGLYGLNIGYWSAGGGRYYNGDICEILVYNRDLTTTELKQVHTYLGQKWGISNTDRSIVDLSGNDDNGLLGAGTVAYMPSYDYYNKGSLRFDGSDDYVDLGTNASLTSLTNNITVEVWIKIPISTNRYTIYGNGYSGTGMMFGTSANTPGGLEVYYPSIYVAYSTAGVLQPDVWQHVVYTRNGSGLNTHAFYINGVSQTVTQTANGGDSWGTSGTNRYLGLRGGVMFNGQMSSVKVYSRALSATEISQNYEAQKSKFANTIVQQGLVLNLDAGNPYSYGGAGTTFYDVSGNNNYFQLTNSPSYVSAEPKNFSLTSASSQHFLYYASIGNPTGSTGISLPSANSWTCAFWFKTSTNTTYNPFLSHMGSGPVYCLMGTTGTTLTYYHYNGGWLFKNATTNVLDNVWHQAVFVNTANTMIIYLDGVVEKSSFSSTADNASNLVNGFGGSWTGTFTGNLSNFMYYNTNLSAAQVLQNYNATKGRFGL